MKGTNFRSNSSIWPYLLMSISFGSILIIGLYSIVQEMLRLGFSWADMFGIFLLLSLLGSMTVLGIVRVIQIKRGAKIEDSTQGGRPTPQQGFWVGVGFAVILFLAGFGSLWDNIQFLKEARSVPGVVTRWIFHSAGYKKPSHYNLEVRFVTPDGLTKIRECNDGAWGHDINLPQVGSNVEVLYNPKNPLDVQVNLFWSFWFRAIFFLGVGIVFSVMSFLNYSKLKKPS